MNTFEESTLALSPLHSLLALKRVEEVKQILEMRPDLIHTHNSNGKSLFSINIKRDWLYDLDFDSSSLPDDVLFTALKDSRFKDFQRLFVKGANLKFVNENEKTVLHIAASIEDVETFSFIRDNFAVFEFIVNEVDSEGNTCLHYAVQNEKAALHMSTDKNEKDTFISFLVKKVADIHHRNIYGQSPLNLARNISARDQLVNLIENYMSSGRMKSNK